MSIPSRIAAGNALLNRSRAVLAAVESGRCVGAALASSPGIAQKKPVPHFDGATRPAFSQRHGG